MPSQGVAKWNGIEIQVSARMSRTPGVVPDQGQIAFRQGAAELPTAEDINGDLEFFYGGAKIDEFKDARITKVIDARGRNLDWQYNVKDRRWRWQYPVIWGRYNVRDDDNKLEAGTEKTPRELATLLLQALGETGFNVEDLPDDAELSPAVDWDFTPVARQLQELVAMYGCDVHLLPNNTVKIIREGTGSLPPEEDLERTPVSGLTILDAPDEVAAFAGDTVFESWLELEPIMYEYPDGKTVPLEDSELKPAAGWNSVDLDECLAIAESEADPVVQQRKRQQVKDHLYRTWRPKKFAGEATKPPGYTVEIVDGEEVPYPDVEDMRLILPLMPTRLLPGENSEAGEKKMSPAELGGFFWDTELSRNIEHANFRLIENKNFQIDTERGHIRLSRPAYRYAIFEESIGGEHMPARLWLRCGYHLRQTLYGPKFTHKFQKPTGYENDTQPEWINRSDIYRTVIATYPADYTEPFTPGSPVDNVADIEEILENACDQRILQYAVQQDPTVYPYNKLKQVSTSGRTKQVTHECGHGKLAKTTASVNYEHDRQQPLAYQKQQIQRDRDQAAKAAQKFQISVKMAKTALAFGTNGMFGQ